MAALMAFISLLVMTRFVAVEYGVMMWGFALVSLVNTVADMGFNSANLKFIAKEGYDRSACFSTYLVVKAILTAILVVLVLVTVYWMRYSDMITDEALQVCLVLLVYQVISNIQFAIFYTLDGLMMSGKSAILTLVECFVRNAVLIVMALYCVNAVVLSQAYVLATVVSVIISFYMVYQAKLNLVRPKYLREYTVFAMPLAIGLIMTTAVTYLDKVIVGLFFESIEVTYYSTAVGLIATFTTIGVSLNNVLLPHLSKNIKDGESPQQTIWSLERAMLIFLSPFIIFFLILGPQIAEVLFGPDFGPSGQMIAVLSIQIIPFVIAGIMTQVLYALNKGKSYMRASIVMCIISVIGFFILIPDSGYQSFCMGYGGIGASISIVAAYIIFAIILVWMVRKSIKYRMYPKIWKIAVAFALSLALLYMTNYFIGFHGLILLAIAGIMVEFVFIGILIGLKELNKKDVFLIWKKFRDDED